MRGSASFYAERTLGSDLRHYATTRLSFGRPLFSLSFVTFCKETFGRNEGNKTE